MTTPLSRAGRSYRESTETNAGVVMQDRAYDGAGTKERAVRHREDGRASWRDAPRGAAHG